MVLRTVDHVRRGLPSPSKFAPNWEGPYLIREAYDSGYYKLATADGTILADPINGKWLKRYCSSRRLRGKQWPPYTQINPSFVICGLSYTTHPHLTSREARARGANVDAHFLPKPKPKASKFALRTEHGAQDLKRLLPNVKYGSPGPIIAERGWSFSLTSGCGRHVHKNVYRNSVYRNNVYRSEVMEKTKASNVSINAATNKVHYSLSSPRDQHSPPWLKLLNAQPAKVLHSRYTADTTDCTADAADLSAQGGKGDSFPMKNTAPDVTRNHEEDKARANEAKGAAIATKAATTQEQRPA
uniref:Uncharacterized protein n=1 Tax=Fagus sylvatica TaxID=28930 RepID=A0A2N9FQC2_FAGSY